MRPLNEKIYVKERPKVVPSPGTNMLCVHCKPYLMAPLGIQLTECYMFGSRFMRLTDSHRTKTDMTWPFPSQNYAKIIFQTNANPLFLVPSEVTRSHFFLEVVGLFGEDGSISFNDGQAL